MPEPAAAHLHRPAHADAPAPRWPALRRRLWAALAREWQRLCAQAERKTRFVPYC